MRLSVDERGGSTARTLLLWGCALIGVVVIASVAVSIVLGVLFSVVSTVATLLALGAVIYLLAWLFLGGDGDASRSDDDSLLDRVRSTGADASKRTADPIDRLTERYLDGEIDEAEYERRVELHLDGPDETEDVRVESGDARVREFER